MTKQEFIEIKQAVDNLIDKTNAQKEALEDARKDIMRLRLRLREAREEIKKLSI